LNGVVGFIHLTEAIKTPIFAHKRTLLIYAKSTMITDTPAPPYYAVIFTSVRTPGDNGYEQMADKMLELAQKQEGFLGVESARDEIGITVSYWRDLDSIKKWKENEHHILAREKGREKWYKSFTTRIAKVERHYQFSRVNDD